MTGTTQAVVGPLDSHNRHSHLDKEDAVRHDLEKGAKK